MPDRENPQGPKPDGIHSNGEPAGGNPDAGNGEAANGPELPWQSTNQPWKQDLPPLPQLPDAQGQDAQGWDLAPPQYPGQYVFGGDSDYLRDSAGQFGAPETETTASAATTATPDHRRSDGHERSNERPARQRRRPLFWILGSVVLVVLLAGGALFATNQYFNSLPQFHLQSSTGVANVEFTFDESSPWTTSAPGTGNEVIWTTSSDPFREFAVDFGSLTDGYFAESTFATGAQLDEPGGSHASDEAATEDAASSVFGLTTGPDAAVSRLDPIEIEVTTASETTETVQFAVYRVDDAEGVTFVALRAFAESQNALVMTYHQDGEVGDDRLQLRPFVETLEERLTLTFETIEAE
ncbi:MAG: hypothetical protein ACTHXA_03340 [Gulosibacter sp.]|uniref:hypothetical protein n=1 Tax=Gulosibacter sp. TaxID=2817531 RepID=UPI003F8DEFE1